MWKCVLCYFADKLIVDGLVVSLFVWLVLYLYKHIGRPEVIFADFIEKTTFRGQTSYRIKYMNIGYKDLIECRRIVKLSLYTHDTPDGKGRFTSAYLEFGDSTIVPVIYGAKNFKDDYKNVAADIHLGSMWEFLKADRYHQSIVEAAKNNSLTLENVLERYGSDKRTSIEVYIWGSDSHGERMYFHHIYRPADGGIKSDRVFCGRKIKNVLDDQNISPEKHKRFERYQELLKNPKRLTKEAVSRELQEYLSEVEE